MSQPTAVSAGRYPFVLSGGGARGYAHLGVLKAFAEHGVFPEAIAATSAGSIIAAFICDGYTSDEVNEIARNSKLGVSMQWKNWRSGFLSLKAVEDLLNKHLRSTTFEQLRIPLYITATNFLTGERMVFSKGPIVPAILGASSIPLLFQPIEIDGIPYVDGGLTGNLPVEPLLPHYKNIIGVHVNPITPYNPAGGLRANIERTLNMAIHEPVALSSRLCTRFIEPDGLRQFGVFDFKRFDDIYRAGLDYTRKLLQEAPL